MDDPVAINMTELPRTVSSDSARERNPELDAEMEKVFRPPVKFEILDTSLEVQPGHHTHFDENDYERHRHMDHHHHHHPLSPLRRNKSFPRMSPTDRPHHSHHHHHHHSSGKHHHQRPAGLADHTEISPISEGEGEGEGETETDGGEAAAADCQVRVVIEEAEDDDREEREEEAEAEEEVKEEEPRRNIPKFIIGDPDQDEDASVHLEVSAEPDGAATEEKESKKHRHHHHHHHRHHHRDKDGLIPEDSPHRHHRHHHHKKHSSADLQELRYRKGSSVNLEGLTRVPTELEEALTLKEADLGEMGIHRLADVPGVHRHRVTRKVSSLIHIGQRSAEQLDQLEVKRSKKDYDHRPHEVFVELDELFRDEGHDMQWKEKARWIKFEEDVEEGSNRWGKPHVASLTFHSLIELRKRLAMGAILLDLEEKNLSDIFHRIVEKMITSDQIPEESTGDVLRALLLKHKHVHDRHGLLKNISSVSLSSMMASHHHDNMHRNTQSEYNFRHLKEGGGILKNMSAISLSGHDKDKMAKHATEPADMELKYEQDVKVPMLMPSREELNITELEDEAPVGLLQPPPNPHGPRPLHISRSFARRLDQQRLEGIMRKIPAGAEATTVLVGEVDFLKRPALVFVRLAEGTVLENFSEVPIPVRFVFVLLGPVDVAVDYHEIGRCFSTLMSSETFHETAYSADCMEDLLSAMNKFIDDSVVLPAGNWDKDLLLPILRTQNMKMRQRRNLKDALQEEEEEMDDEDLLRRETTEVDYKVRTPKKRAKFIDPLKRTGCLFGGLVNDIKRRYPWYLSDLRDSLNLQCFASIFFMFFACISPAITFGGLLAEKTGNLMGVSEMVLGTSICGVVFALTSGQPLIIIGATGPLLVFEENLYSFCVANDIEFLPFRAWVGIWICIICTVTVALEGGVLVRLFTRFTEEIFSFLISLIFIYEVFKKLSKVFSLHPLLESYCFDETDDWLNSTETAYGEEGEENGTVMTTAGLWPADNGTAAGNRSACTSSSEDKVNMPNTALLSTLLTLGTFFLAYFLRILRNSRFLGRGARKTIGDFGIPIAIVIMVALDLIISPTTYTQKLEVPDGLEPTDSCARGWFVNPLGIARPLPAGLVFAAILPAFLSFILIYMESQITSLIINKKDNRLKKGSGFHLDMFIIGVLAGVNSLLGLPWMCSATVRSVTHLGSLSIHSKTHAPGERPRLEGIREQRVTGFLVNLFIGLSIALAPLLRQVPIAVLFGVFLYMGIVSLNGLQMVERSKLMFMPVKHHPDVPYTRKVKSFRMHMFTSIQLICLALLWTVKSTPAALAFPFFLILLLPVRGLLERLFSSSELDALDNEEAEVDPEEEDEYQTHMPV